VLPLLFFSIGGAAYGNYLMTNNLLTNVIASSGTTTIEIRGWKINSTNTMDANGNGFILGDELQIQEVKDADSLTEGLIICVNPIFPDWQLKLSVDVHNMAISTPVLLNTTIQYYDSNGILRDTDATGLWNMFKLRFTSTWYNSTGHLIPDIATYDLFPCRTVTSLESLTFEGTNNPELQGQEFAIVILIGANLPE